MDKIIKSISHAFVIDALSAPAIDKEQMEKTGVVLCQRIKKMPLSVRALIYTSAFIFDWSGILYGGCRFSVQDTGHQQKMLNSMQRYNWAPLKQFSRFYQKFSLYIYYAILEEIKKP